MDGDNRVCELVERHVYRLVDECVATFRVTIINGLRQAGKSTRLQQLHARLCGRLVTLDDAAQRTAARDDPDGYLQALPRPLFVSSNPATKQQAGPTI